MGVNEGQREEVGIKMEHLTDSESYDCRPLGIQYFKQY